MRCLFDSPAAACKQLKLYRHDGTQTMVCRAHNHRRADEGRWYVVPSAEWPPYAHAVYFADWDPVNEGAIRIGALFYRGLHPSIQAQMTKPAGKALLMQRHWRWRELLDEDDEELFIEPLMNAASNIHPQKLQISVASTQVPENVGGDPYDQKREWSKVLFEVDRSGALSSLDAGAEPGDLAKLGEVEDIDAFLAGLRDHEPDEWTWTEVSVFQTLGTAQSSSTGKAKKKKTKARSKAKVDPADHLVTTHELYETLIAPFEVWLFGEE